MRNLNSQQKKALTHWFKENYPNKTSHYKFDLADQIEPDTYDLIDKMHPCEINYQNINHFLEDLVNKRN